MRRIAVTASRTRAPVALTDPSEPCWTKPVHALQLQGPSWACDHRPWLCERVLYSLHRRVLAVLHLDPIGASPAIGAIDALGDQILKPHVAGSPEQVGADFALPEWRDENAADNEPLSFERRCKIVKRPNADTITFFVPLTQARNAL
jgi:hypothetical protein